MKTPPLHVLAFIAMAGLTAAQEPPAPSQSLPPAGTDLKPKDKDTAPPAAEAPPAAAAPEIDGLAGFGSAVPEAYRDDRYEATFKKNPFATRTPVPSGPPGPGLADDWELKGIQDNGGVQKAMVMNKKTSQVKHLTVTPDKEGFSLVKINFAATRKERTVEIAKGSETATLSFPETASPGSPGRPPGMPNAPGQMPQPAGQRPYPGTVNAVNPQGGIRPPGNAIPRPTTGGIPPNTSANRAGSIGVPQPQPQQQQQRTIGVTPPTPSTGSRRRLLVPTPAPGPAQR